MEQQQKKWYAAPRIEEIVKNDHVHREKEAQKQIEAMQHHMEQLMQLVEGAHPPPMCRSSADRGTTVTRVIQKEAELKLTKLTDVDDIKAYLTIFKRVMGAYEIEKAKWTFRLARQLTGKAQQAYAGMTSVEAGKYKLSMS